RGRLNADAPDRRRRPVPAGPDSPMAGVAGAGTGASSGARRGGTEMTAEGDGRGVWRAGYASIVDHRDFPVLSPPARLTLLGARLGSSNAIASIFRWHASVLQEQTGLDAAALEAALIELETKPPRRPWIIRDERVLWIRNGLRFDPSVVLANPNH